MSEQDGSDEPDLFTARGDGDCVIAHGNRLGRIVLRIAASGRQHVLVEGEPEGRFLADCFRDGLACNCLNKSAPTLVDLRNFIGAIDWGAIENVSSMATWGSHGDERSHVAYVLRNDEFEMLIKIARELFPHTEHRTFRNLGEAIAWLDSMD